MNKNSVHDYSTELDKSENEKIFESVEKTKGISKSTAIIQLWVSKAPAHKEFSKLDTGVVCLVKDLNKNTFYFRLYSLAAEQLWEQEIYINLPFDKITDKFYYFPAEDCNVGFNFAFVKEACKFVKAINNALVVQREKSNVSLASLPVEIKLPINKLPDKSTDSKWKFFGTITTIKQAQDNTKKKISKLEISSPTNFQHKEHMGLDDFLRNNNIKPSKKALKEADNIIKNNGGYEKFNATLKEKTQSSAPFQPIRPPPRIPEKPKLPRTEIPTNQYQLTRSVSTVLSEENNAQSSIPPPIPPPLDSTLMNSKKQIDKSSLLDSIQNFDQTGLKPIHEPQQSQDTANNGDIVDQLREALEKMREFMEDDSDDDDEDWK